jgi:hypothetical protein
MSEKSPLPSIIVTPSSPSSSHDYCIAFLAPPPKPTFGQRVISSFQNTLQPRARTTLIFTFLFFLLLCHYLAHRIAISRSHLDILPLENDFDSQLDVPGANSWFGDWFQLSAFWNHPSQRETVGDFARILDSGS